MIIDLSELNKFVSTQHFKMDHLSTATDMLFPGAWLASIDLKDAYYAIPVCHEHRKYLCFQWNHKYFQFNCVPFGLSSAPWIFTKTLKPIFSKFHEAGFQGFGYIDDSFIIAESQQECVEAVLYLTDLFKSLGFRVHDKKSVLTPTHEIIFLGYSLNSNVMTVSPPPEKKEKVKQRIKKLKAEKRPKIRQVASTLRLLNDVCKACEYGLSHVKNLEIQKIKALKYVGGKQFEGKMSISKASLKDLNWWENNIDSANKEIHISPPDIEMSTDASSQGWGACSHDHKTGGRWSFEETQLHINALKIKAVELGPKS